MERLSWRDKQGIAHAPVAKPCLISFTGISSDRLAAYEDTGLTPEEIPHWIPVSENLPEYDELLQRYSDPTMELISILACGHLDSDEKLSVCEVNRLLIKKTGIKQLDEQYTGKWEWSKHFKDVICWMPLPAAPKEENDARI